MVTFSTKRTTMIPFNLFWFHSIVSLFRKFIVLIPIFVSNLRGIVEACWQTANGKSKTYY